jgi:hypothetical protein
MRAGMLTRVRAPRPWTAALLRAARFAPLTCIAVLLFVVWCWGTKPVQDSHFGDDQEYLTMTMSFVLHGSPAFKPGDDVEMFHALPMHWRRTLQNKFFFLQAPAAYFKAKDGAMYGFHFFTYPAVVAPLRALMRSRSDAFRAHQYTNLLCFSLALLSLLALRSQPQVFWTLMPLVFLTPVLWFLRYAHTESFVFSLGVVAISCYLKDRVLLAILFNSIAATQYQPLALLSLFLYAQWLWCRRAALSDWPALRRTLPRALMGGMFCAIILVPGIFYFAKFGTPNLIAREGFASVHLMSLSKFAWMFVDPNGGMLFYTPGVLCMLLVATGWALRRAQRERQLWGLGLLGCALLTMFASTCQRNWNHPTFGVSRYVLYGVAPCLLFIGNEVRRRHGSCVGLAGVATVAALQLFAHCCWGYFEYSGRDSAHHSSPARYVLDHWPALYSPPSEIFCERTLVTCHTDPSTGEPLPEYLPAIWRDKYGRPRKILAERCNLERVLRASAWSAPQSARIRAAMQRCRGTGTIYIEP